MYKNLYTHLARIQGGACPYSVNFGTQVNLAADEIRYEHGITGGGG